MEIVTVVDFLCRGEANIIQENLDSFFALAQELQLEGLVGLADGQNLESARQHSIEAKQFQSSQT